MRSQLRGDGSRWSGQPESGGTPMYAIHASPGPPCGQAASGVRMKVRSLGSRVWWQTAELRTERGAFALTPCELPVRRRAWRGQLGRGECPSWTQAVLASSPRCPRHLALGLVSEWTRPRLPIASCGARTNRDQDREQKRA